MALFSNYHLFTGDMLLAGVLPINNMRDFVEPASAISIRIPQHILEAVFGITIVRDLDVFDSPNRPPTSHEMLTAYCKVRGYITNGTGRWDEFRATKEILKDFNEGCLLYVTPPEIDDLDIQRWVSDTEKTIWQNKKVMERLERRKLKMEAAIEEEIATIATDQQSDGRARKRIPRKYRKLRDPTPYDEDHGTQSYVPLFKNRNLTAV